MNFVDSSEWLPLDTFDLFKTEPSATLKNVSDSRQRFGNSIDLFQAFDILGAKVGSRRRQLHRSRSREDDFRAHICSAPLEIIGHAASQSRE